MTNDWIHVYVVYRIDYFMLPLVEDVSERVFTVKEVLLTPEEADAEVERLNESVDKHDRRYFWQSAKFYSKGRQFESDKE